MHALFALWYSRAEKQTNRVGRGRGVEDILFWTLLPPLNFSFFNFIPGNSRQICLLSNPYKIPRPKTKTPLEIPHYFFFTLGNSTSFLDNPWKFNMLFLWYPWPWKFRILNSLLFFFSGIAHCISSFKGYVLQKFVKYNQQVFYFLFLWLPSTVSEKKDFCHKFSFFNRFIHPPPPPPPHPHPSLNSQNLLNLAKVFCWCSLNM